MKETRSLPAELFAGRTLIFQLAKMILKEIRRFLPGDRLGVCTAGCDGHGLLVCFWYDKEFITKTGTVRAVADRRTDSWFFFRTD